MKRPTTRTTIDWDAAHRRLAALSAAGETAAGVTPEQAQGVLDARAVELARVPAAPESAVARLEVVTFSLAGERYALETRFIREIVRPREVTPVPGAAEFLVGVMNLRGSILAVMDLARLLGVHTDGGRPWVAVLGMERAEFGLAAEAIGEVTALRTEEVLPAAMADAAAGVVRGVTREALIVLDGAALLEDSRLFIDETS